MLRHYESLGLVRPTGRTVGGYREYRAEDLRRIFEVEALRSLGLSLRQVGQALEDPGFEPAALIGELILWAEDRVRRERELLERLRAVDASSPAGWPDVLRIVELMRGLGSPDAARRQQAVLAGEDVPVPVELLAGAVLAEADPNVAGALRWALARSGGGEGVSSLAVGVSSGDAAVRRRAVVALGEMPGDEVVAVLADALGDVEVSVRGPAALALGSRGVVGAVPVLVGMVVDGVNDVEAAEVLGELAVDPGRADLIVGALAGELAAHAGDRAVRFRLVQALAELPGEVGRGLLVELAGDGDRAVALFAGTLLRRPV